MAGVGTALWIGGGQGSGKTSIALAISRRFDLQLYTIDRRTWAHLARVEPSEFMSLSLDERWVYPDPARMLDWFIEASRERISLVVEDLARLPRSPLVVVEGPQVLPSFIAPLIESPDQALFLVSEPNAQRARLVARGGMTETSDPERARANSVERDLLISKRIATEAAVLGFPTLTVDRPLDEMIDAAAAHFEPSIRRGPRDADLRAIRRIENEGRLRTGAALPSLGRGETRAHDGRDPVRMRVRDIGMQRTQRAPAGRVCRTPMRSLPLRISEAR